MIISFNSLPILDDAEGIILDWQRGTINVDKIIEPMARGNGEFVKYLNEKGTDHTVSFAFLNVNPANQSAIENRILDFATYKDKGTFLIPDKDVSIPNCVVSDVQYNANNRTNIINDDYTVEERRYLEFTITFRQLKK